MDTLCPLNKVRENIENKRIRREKEKPQEEPQGRETRAKDDNSRSVRMCKTYMDMPI